MPPLNATRNRAYLTLGALALVALHLGWESLNGGVRSHHLLARSDLPSFSNWWGIILVPTLTWLVGKFKSWWAIAAAAAYGAALAFSFAFGLGVEGYLFIGLFVVSLFLPTYRGEYIAGFVLGMMFTFGAVLPTLVAVIVAAFSLICHYAVKLVLKLARRRKEPVKTPGGVI